MDHHQTLETYSGSFFRNLRRKFWRGKWMWPAAIILFLLSFALWQWFGMRMTHIRTNNSTTTVQLPDQSEVLLSTHSSLRYHKHFLDAAQREVWLKGDAVFLVNPRETVPGQAGAPFIVHTATLDITASAGSFRVTVKGGAVKVQQINGSASIHFKRKDLADKVLQPGEMLEYSGGGQPTLQKSPL